MAVLAMGVHTMCIDVGIGISSPLSLLQSYMLHGTRDPSIRVRPKAGSAFGLSRLRQFPPAHLCESVGETSGSPSPCVTIYGHRVGGRYAEEIHASLF